MKRLVLLTLALLMVAMPAMAQVAPFTAVPDYFRMGKILVTAAATDTFHFEDTLTDNAIAYQGYETVYVPNGSNGLDTERAFVVAAVLYADSPFEYAAAFRNGDTQGRFALADTQNYPVSAIAGGAVGNIYAEKYPCWTVIRGDLDEIRVDPTASDSLFCIPLMDYKMD